jgi:hypothetical protein
MPLQFVMENFPEIAFVHHLAAGRAFVEMIGLVLRFTPNAFAVHPADGDSSRVHGSRSRYFAGFLAFAQRAF